MNRYITSCLIIGLIGGGILVKKYLFERRTDSNFESQKTPLPEEVIKLINEDTQIIEKNVIDYEWIKGDIQIMTGVIKGPLDGHGFEFIAIKNQYGWQLQKIRPWQS